MGGVKRPEQKIPGRRVENGISSIPVGKQGWNLLMALTSIPVGYFDSERMRVIMAELRRPSWYFKYLKISAGIGHGADD